MTNTGADTPHRARQSVKAADGPDSLPAFRLPMPEDAVTCSDLYELSRAVGRLRRELIFIGGDLDRRSKAGVKYVYLLDFSELHAYLWPHTSKSQHKTVVTHLLSHTDLDFALPPAAVGELILSLNQLAAAHKRTRDTVGRILSRPFVQAFLMSSRVSLEEDRAGFEVPQSETVKEVLAALDHVQESDRGLSRLGDLYARKRLRHLSDFVNPADATPDPAVLQDALFRLTSNRPTRDYAVNYADAHNYALAYALTNKYYTSHKTAFFLVTSSPIPYAVFEAIKWKEDPLFAALPGNLTRTSLVRHPLHLQYLARLGAAGSGSPTDAALRKTLLQAQKDLRTLHTTWSNVALYRRYVKDADVPGWTKVRLPRSRGFLHAAARFAAFYVDVFRPIQELVSADSAREGNRRRLLGVGRAQVGGVQYADLVDESATPSTDDDRVTLGLLSSRAVLGLFDRLIQSTETELRKATRALRQFPKRTTAELDKTGLVFPHARLHTAERWNANRGCVELSVEVRENQQADRLILADRYADYTSLWWETAVEFPAFVQATYLFHRSVTRSCQQAGGLRDLRPKAFDGIYFRLLGGNTEHFKLAEAPDFRPDSLLALCKATDKVQGVRIAFPYADLSYDFGPLDSDVQTVGIVTHLQCVDQVAEFILATHTKWVRWSAVHQAMRKVFSAGAPDVTVSKGESRENDAHS